MYLFLLCSVTCIKVRWLNSIKYSNTKKHQVSINIIQKSNHAGKKIGKEKKKKNYRKCWKRSLGGVDISKFRIRLLSKYP